MSGMCKIEHMLGLAESMVTEAGVNFEDEKSTLINSWSIIIGVFLSNQSFV